MHIDHRGGAVNPIAIKELFFIIEPRNDDLVLLRDINSAELPEEQFRISECLPRHKIENWDAWCHDEYEKRKNDPTVTWSNYVRSAVLYLQHLNTDDNGTFAPALKGMNALVSGNIPRAAGLSTSSALVVAAAEACIRINNLEVDTMELVDICGAGEWYVGTRGGSGDHPQKIVQHGARVRVSPLVHDAGRTGYEQQTALSHIFRQLRRRRFGHAHDLRQHDHRERFEEFHLQLVVEEYFRRQVELGQNIVHAVDRSPEGPRIVVIGETFIENSGDKKHFIFVGSVISHIQKSL